MKSYEVDLYRRVVRTEHTRVSVEAETPEEARAIAMRISTAPHIIWAEPLSLPAEIGDAATGEVEAIVDFEETP